MSADAAVKAAQEAVALIDIPEIARIERASLKPGDVLVCTAPGMISNSTAERITQFLRELWPDNKVVVLGDGLTLKVVSPEPDGK